MKKFRIIGSNDILNEGEAITYETYHTHGNVRNTYKVEGSLSGEILKEMLEDGVIEEIKDKIAIKPKKHKPSLRELMDCNNYHAVLDILIKRLMKKTETDYIHFKDMIDRLSEAYPACIWSLFLREMALMIDETYPKNIRTCEDVWFVSITDKHIHSCETWRIKEWDSFAGFRTYDDAVFAVDCLNSITSTGMDNDIDKY